jgi:hypothetical protein
MRITTTIFRASGSIAAELLAEGVAKASHVYWLKQLL